MFTSMDVTVVLAYEPIRRFAAMLIKTPFVIFGTVWLAVTSVPLDSSEVLGRADARHAVSAFVNRSAPQMEQMARRALPGLSVQLPSVWRPVSNELRRLYRVPPHTSVLLMEQNESGSAVLTLTRIDSPGTTPALFADVPADQLNSYALRACLVRERDMKGASQREMCSFGAHSNGRVVLLRFKESSFQLRRRVIVQQAQFAVQDAFLVIRLESPVEQRSPYEQLFTQIWRSAEVGVNSRTGGP